MQSSIDKVSGLLTGIVLKNFPISAVKQVFSAYMTVIRWVKPNNSRHENNIKI